MEPLAAESPLVPVGTIKGDDGPLPLVTAPSLALTDTGAKPRWTGWLSNPEPASGSPPIDDNADETDGGAACVAGLRLDTL